VNPLIIVGGISAGVAMFLLSKKSHALSTGGITVEPATVITDYSLPWEQEMRNACAEFALDWRLMAAHIKVESDFNALAVNKNDPSYGLGQIYCTADDKNSPCTNKFPAVEGFNSYTPNDLLDAATNLYIMAQIMASNISAYGLPKAIAVYNDWSAHTSPETGPFPNQDYVNKVQTTYEHYKQLPR
jgi:hypothetical protein